ncbi:MAG: helix-turn-helix domain-containing protein [Desulfovibrio sp.]|jgi:phage repressor protein C with HTH and peptisase S24 domain|nr:helix-turn-helix domain-containing protein [Desulfovibrio sp.]
MKNELTRKVLRFWLKKTGMSQVALAEKSGISTTHITNMANGVRGITTENLEKICNVFDISIPEFFELKENTPEIVLIDRLKAIPQAGRGGLVVDGDCVGKYAFHNDFIRRKGGNPEDMKIFQIQGDSMTPTLNSGDLIMINQQDNMVRQGNIYLLRLEGELMVKRLENRPGGFLLIRSDNNERYNDIEVNKNSEDVDIQVFGRMVWSCREY